MTFLSHNFTLDDATFSSTAQRLGIDNTPGPVVLENIRTTAAAMENIRHILFSQPIRIDSWYRCGVLNGAVGGSKTSAHMDGYAVDFVCPAFGPPLQVVKTIESSGILFDQCIQEGSWVHISFNPKNRSQVLTAHFGPNGVTYTQGV